MRELKGWHVLAIMLGFFGVIIGVNTVFVTYALSTFAGEDEKQPYLKGLAYNRALDARAAQAALGWSAEIDAMRADGGETLIRVRLEKGDAKPVGALDVTARLRHPVNSYLDRTVKLTATLDGVYEARVPDLVRGQWDVVAQTRSSEGTDFTATRRVLLP
jgi:nitrogen fixation protein FixH